MTSIIYSSSSIHSYPPQCGGRFSVLGSDASRVASSSSGGLGSFSPLGPSKGGPPGIFSFYSMPTLFHFGNSTASGGLGVECLQPSLEISGKLCVSFSGSGPSCSVQVSSRTCQWSTQMFTSGVSMLDGGSLASHSSQHAGRCSLAVPSSKRSHHGCSVGQVLKGLQYLHLTLWLLSDVCYAGQEFLFLSLSGSGRGNSNVYIKGLPAVLEGVGWVVCSTGFTKQCPLCP